MKKIALLFSAAIVMVSCGNDNTSGTTTPTDTEATTTTPDTATPATASADADKGLELIAASDCLTCHKVEEKLVGPAYREIANKYPNDPATIDSLATRVITGSSGRWGQLVMTPHATLSKEDAQTMVKYVMSLKQ